ncbi:adhesion G-protein coupled receptor F1 [Mugil cephalus]|uniref:adhesion G-protein coupled receptor F1 n=1 Tax=Mugil cephalus TaxID=48193 RepID=UPI001FB7324C|nr:adhesion G-protein coupled receptor F1 [Mugil cephalus]
MVEINAPPTTVCYLSTPEMNCTFEEATGSAGWNMTRHNERFELNTGTVVQLHTSCATEIYKSCVKVTLQKVTGIWEGIYECGFIEGSVRHTAKTKLNVALLPDEITMEINPLTVVCPNHSVTVSTTIRQTPEAYAVKCMNCLVYTLKNKTDSQFCESGEVNGVSWPKTPVGETVVIRKCPEGKTGYLSRTCDTAAKWQNVFSSCVSIELTKVLDSAENFIKGLGATQEVALNIFEGLKNTSESNSTDDADSADVSASINVLNVMSEASATIQLSESVFPNLVSAASNMLNSNWTDVNETIRHSMSSKYLVSMENLVKNVMVDNSTGFNSTNLDLSFCSSSSCNVSVFDIDVSLQNTTGLVKTVAVRNLMEKLRNNFQNTDPNRLLLSATMQNSSNSSIQIKLNFPNDRLITTDARCVFWNTTSNEWSDAGCTANQTDVNYTLCECNHLTSFSVLMSRSNIPSPELDIITYVGLGVSICSLLIFLIIEFIVWSAVVKTNLSHFRHTALVNIATFLLLADGCFLASASGEELSENLCLAFTVGKHLFFLAKFCWMLCLSVMLVHQLIFVFSPLRKRVFMFLSSIVGYVCPILIVGSSYVYCKYTDQPYYNKKSCWLVYEKLLVGSIHAFILPVGTVILTNLFSMVVVIVTLMKSSVPDNSKADDKETAKSIIKVVVFLTPVFGVTWIIGFFLITMNDEDPMREIVNYSFTILNSFQGFFILITGCFAETKVRQELFKIITAKSKGKSESTKNLTSTMYTKDK